ncbi:MAG: ABC transporter ATP-binding protein [Actinomycetota bacterium]
MIEARNLTKKFNGHLAVDNISFEVNESEILALLGPNGAGKTTTIRMLATLIMPSSGKITIDGRDAGKNGGYIRSITGILTETPGMYEKISAYQNLSYFSSFYGIGPQKREENIEKFLKMFDLWERKDELVATYSKGMKQKLALARALIHEPKILFLDEPTSGLDPESARMVRDFIISLKKERTTVILCTHNLHEASSLSDRVCILKREIIKVATLAQLQDNKKTREAEILLDSEGQRFVPYLKEIEGVVEARAEGNRIHLTVANPRKANPEAARILVEKGAGIVYINQITESLEEIYLDLINKGKNE